MASIWRLATSLGFYGASAVGAKGGGEARRPSGRGSRQVRLGEAGSARDGHHPVGQRPLCFASAKSDLLPSAELKLNDVATALTEQDPDSKIVVEGHTDSQGSAAFNQDLSQKRAQSVRDLPRVARHRR